MTGTASVLFPQGDMLFDSDGRLYAVAVTMPGNRTSDAPERQHVPAWGLPAMIPLPALDEAGWVRLMLRQMRGHE